MTAAGVSPGGQTEAEELVDVPESEPAAAAPAPASAPVPVAQPAPAAAPSAEVPKAPEATPAAPAPAPPAPTAVAAEPKATESAAPAEVSCGCSVNADHQSASDEIPDDELTEEQKKQKARAARFGIPFKVTKPKPAPAAPAPTPAAAKPEQAKKDKPAAIDKAPLGESAEVLARRAAKFGPVKKAEPAAAAPAPATVEKKEELTP